MQNVWQKARRARQRCRPVRQRAVTVTLASIVLATTLAACGSGDDTGSAGDGGTLARLEKAGVVKIAYANEKPVSYKDGDELTGYEFELLKQFFAEHDVKVEGELVDFAALLPGLQAKRYDMVGAGMFILPDRCEVADFGPPEYQTGAGLAVEKGNPLNIQSYADVASSDAVFGTSAGVAEISYAEVAGVPEGRIKTFPSYADAAAALAAGQIDVMAQLDTGLPDTLEALNSDNVEQITLSEQPQDKDGKTAVGYGGAVFPKSATDLRDAYTAWLTKAREDGSYAKILKDFGYADANIPPADLTAADICAGNTPN
jgi:polar amino acid transport system substrate-binding protein